MTRTIALAPVQKVLRVEVKQTHAFDVFTSRIGLWWPHSPRSTAAFSKRT